MGQGAVCKPSITPPLRGSRRGRAEWRRPIRRGELRRRHLPAAKSHSRDASSTPHPTRLRAEPHPGTRASRPQPYSWLEVVERQRKVAGRQPPSRRERRLASPNEGQGPVAVRSQRRSRPRLCRANVRAGRPRSRVGIIHTTNREHDLHHAQEWDKGPFASLSITPPLRGSRRDVEPNGEGRRRRPRNRQCRMARSCAPCGVASSRAPGRLTAGSCQVPVPKNSLRFSRTRSLLPVTRRQSGRESRKVRP